MVRPHSCAQYNLFCMDKEGKIIEMDIADTIMERPYEFHIGEMQFYLYPATLGKIYLLSRLTENLEKIKTKLQLYLNKMASGEFYINGKDCYTNWGISMDTSSLSSLMTPPPLKEFIENKSRLEHGKRVLSSNPKIDERNITLTFNLTAKTEEEFFSRYNNFCEELATGIINIKTQYQPNITYKTIYISCNQFTQFMRGIARFSLKLVEYNPADRNS